MTESKWKQVMCVLFPPPLILKLEQRSQLAQLTAAAVV